MSPAGPDPAAGAGAASPRESITTRKSGVFDLATILVLYAILVTLLLVFVGGWAGEFHPTANAPLGLAAAVIAFITAGLIIFSVALILRVVRGSTQARSASKLRARLAIAFCLVSFVSAAPLAILGWRGLTAAAGNWFDAGTVQSLEGAERLAMDFSAAMAAQLEAGAKADLPPLAARRPPRNAQEILLRLGQSRPGIVSVQIFRGAAEDSFAGDPRYRVPAQAVTGFADGEYPSLSLDGSYALRYLSTHPSDRGDRRYLLSLEFPPSWSGAIRAMGDSSQRATAIMSAIPGFRRSMALVFLAFTAPLLLASAILGISLADAISRPLAALERATHRVAAGDMGARVLTSPGDDFAQLSLAFNRMVAEIDRFRVILLQEEKENAWQDIARKLAHEMKNPLTPIRLSAERVLRKHRSDPPSAAAILEPSMLAIIQEVDGMASLLGEFKDFARLPEPQLEWTGLKKIIDDIAGVYAQSHPGVSFNLQGLEGIPPIKADPGHLRQLFVNLVSNAIDAMNGQGTISIRADLVKYSDTHYCRVEVRDSGPGIPADLQDRLFTPYFTTKENGTGLGLTIAEHIAMGHAGRIWFESEPGAGAAFYVDLPAETRSGTEG